MSQLYIIAAGVFLLLTEVWCQPEPSSRCDVAAMNDCVVPLEDFVGLILYSNLTPSQLGANCRLIAAAEDCVAPLAGFCDALSMALVRTRIDGAQFICQRRAQYDLYRDCYTTPSVMHGIIECNSFLEDDSEEQSLESICRNMASHVDCTGDAITEECPGQPGAVEFMTEYHREVFSFMADIIGCDIDRPGPIDPDSGEGTTCTTSAIQRCVSPVMDFENDLETISREEMVNYCSAVQESYLCVEPMKEDCDSEMMLMLIGLPDSMLYLCTNLDIMFAHQHCLFSEELDDQYQRCSVNVSPSPQICSDVHDELACAHEVVSQQCDDNRDAIRLFQGVRYRTMRPMLQKYDCDIDPDQYEIGSTSTEEDCDTDVCFQDMTRFFDNANSGSASMDDLIATCSTIPALRSCLAERMPSCSEEGRIMTDQLKDLVEYHCDNKQEFMKVHECIFGRQSAAVDDAQSSCMYTWEEESLEGTHPHICGLFMDGLICLNHRIAEVCNDTNTGIYVANMMWHANHRWQDYEYECSAGQPGPAPFPMDFVSGTDHQLPSYTCNTTVIHQCARRLKDIHIGPPAFPTRRKDTYTLERECRLLDDVTYCVNSQLDNCMKENPKNLMYYELSGQLSAYQYRCSHLEEYAESQSCYMLAYDDTKQCQIPTNATMVMTDEKKYCSNMLHNLHCIRPYVSTRCNDVDAAGLIYEIESRDAHPLMYEYTNCGEYKDANGLSLEQKDEDDDKGLSTGGIIGICVAGGVLLIIIVVVAVFIMRRKRYTNDAVRFENSPSALDNPTYGFSGATAEVDMGMAPSESSTDGGTKM